MTKKAVVLHLLIATIFLFPGCGTTSTQPTAAADDAAAQAVGRYVFYLEPTSPTRLLPGGFLLDSVTGDMWSLNNVVTNGQLGPAMLSPIQRSAAKPASR